MSDRMNEKRKKQAISSWANTLLVSPNTPTLSSPIRGFGKQIDAALPQMLESGTGQFSVVQAINDLPRGHDISQIPLYSQDRFSNHLGEFQQSVDAPAVQQKKTLEAQQKEEILQAQSIYNLGGQKKTIMCDGMNIPGGATIETVSGNTGAVISLLEQKAVEAADGHVRAPDFSRYIDRIDQVLSDTSLSDTNIPIDFVEASGINVYWRGYIRFRLGEPESISGGGSGSTSRSFGGSTTSGTEVSTSTSDSAKVTGSGSSTSGTTLGEAGSGGQRSSESSGSVGAEASTTTSRSDKFTDSTTSSRAGTTSMTNTMERFRAPLIAEVYLNPELDVQGSDYFNPFKWGMYIGESISPMRRVRGSIGCGSVTYYISQGLASTPPAQRQGWIEHQLGITQQSTANFANLVKAYSANPVQFSSSGSTPLPQNIAFAAEQYHGVGLGGVHLLHGGQADDYCNYMSAAAFATPGDDGETNIFMHSHVPLDSPQGQHTLLHEVSHAVQQIRGETTGLDGLSGDQSRRDVLEKSADFHADAILSNSRWERNPS